MRRILIVDDSPTQVTLLERLLGRHGFATARAGDGLEALEYALEAAPDLILMDVDMPRMNGLEAIRKLTREPATQHVPIVLMSANGREFERRRGLAHGARRYLMKPFALAELMQVVCELLDEPPRSGPAAGQVLLAD